MRRATLFLALVILNRAASTVVAQQRHLHSSAGVGSNQLPMYVAQDFGLFEKYGLNVQLIVITGGARGLQALFGGSTHSANMAAMAPVRAVLSGDGKVTLVIAPWKIQDYYGTEHRGPGLDHIGFKVENVAAFKNDVEILTKADPEWLAPKSPNLESEYNVVLGLLQRCRYGRHQLPDPEGNSLDVSE